MSELVTWSARNPNAHRMRMTIAMVRSMLSSRCGFASVTIEPQSRSPACRCSGRVQTFVAAFRKRRTCSPQKGAQMAVLGMGGLFFRAADPEALAAWYKEHL